MTGDAGMVIRRTSDRWGVRDLAWIAGFLLVGVVVPLVLTDRAGALDVPRSDDWSYLRTLFEWDRTGRFDFNNWVSMTLVGQRVLAWPVVAFFDESIVAVRVFTAVLGAAGLVAAYGFARRSGLRTSHAALAVGGLAVGPLWGPLAASFMTDVPGFALQSAALVAAGLAFSSERVRRSALVVSLGAGVVAISIRQYAAIPLIAIGLTAVVVASRPAGRADRRWIVAALAVAAVAVLAVLAWWSGIPNRLALGPRLPNGASLKLAYISLGGFLRLAGLFQLPLLLAIGPSRLIARAWSTSRMATLLTSAMAAAVLATTWALQPTVPFVGNYFDRRGTLADDIIHGNRPDVIPGFVFELLTVTASLVAVILVSGLVPAIVRIAQSPWATMQRWWRHAAPLDLVLALTLFGQLAAYELAIAFRLPIFDRYVLTALPLVGVAIVRAVGTADTTPDDDAQTPVADGADVRVRSSARPRMAAAVVALALFAVLGATYTSESAAFDGGRWRAAEAAVAAGLAVEDIDAGYEWSGWYRGIAPGVRPSIEERRRLRRQYVQGLCVQVVIDPQRPPSRVVAEVAVDGWFRSSARLFVVPTGRECASGADLDVIAPPPGFAPDENSP